MMVITWGVIIIQNLIGTTVSVCYSTSVRYLGVSIKKYCYKLKPIINPLGAGCIYIYIYAHACPSLPCGIMYNTTHLSSSCWLEASVLEQVVCIF